MLRTLRKVLQNRSGGNSLRLGQIQAAEKREEVNSLSLSEESVSIENAAASPHGRAVQLLAARANDRDELPLELGFNLARSILLHAKEKHSCLLSISHIGSGGEYDHQTTRTLYGEVKSWCCGAVALCGIWACRHFVTDEHSPLHIEAKDVPKIISRVLLGKPPSTLAVLSGEQQHRGTASPTDGLDEAIASFQSTFSECTAAAQNKLAIKYTTLKKYQKAFLLFEQASERGHPVAQFNLGLCYEHGKGVKSDPVKAAECYEEASKKGHAGALYSLSRYCMEGTAGVQMDQARGLNLLDQAAARGVSKAQCYLGLYYADKSSDMQDYYKAGVLLEQAAVKKDPIAEYHLGVFYEQGLGVERDLTKAGQMYELAAKHGHVSAQYNLGVFHEQGLGGLPVNKTEAARYYRMAAEAGDEDARHNLQLLWQQRAERQTALQTAKHTLISQRSWDRNNLLLRSIFGNLNLAENQQVSSLPRCVSSPGILDDFPVNRTKELELSNREGTSGPLMAF